MLQFFMKLDQNNEFSTLCAWFDVIFIISFFGSNTQGKNLGLLKSKPLGVGASLLS